MNPATSQQRYIPLLFLASRFFLILALPLEGLHGYGDFWNFFGLAGMGLPFFDYWVEFPPLFPFLSTFLFYLAAGREHVYSYLLVFILSLTQAGSLALFLRLSTQIHGDQTGSRRGWVYFAISIGLAYSWWYFDPLPVFLMLLGLAWLLEGRDLLAGLSLALGALTKYFPVLVLVVAWRFRPVRKALFATAVTLGVTLAVWLGLYLLAPDMTTASLRSQFSKGSWETVWALIDGNLNTGNFGPLTERFDPLAALLPRGNPARLSPWLTLPIFAALGAWLYRRAKPAQTFDMAGNSAFSQNAISFLGLAWCLFLLWSPGYSPQWVLYLLPLALLALPAREAYLISVTLVLVNLLEWPVLLSRGYFSSLWITIIIRTFLLVLLAISFWQSIRNARSVGGIPFEEGEGKRV
jgi:hypothetical protein